MAQLAVWESIGGFSQGMSGSNPELDFFHPKFTTAILNAVKNQSLCLKYFQILKKKKKLLTLQTYPPGEVNK